VVLDCPNPPVRALFETTTRRRLPTITPFAGMSRFGGLLDYGPDAFAMTSTYFAVRRADSQRRQARGLAPSSSRPSSSW
jgi:hypothetical protein